MSTFEQSFGERRHRADDDDGSISLTERLARMERSIDQLRIDTEHRFAKVEAAFSWKAFLAFVGITGSGWGVALSIFLLRHP